MAHTTSTTEAEELMLRLRINVGDLAGPWRHEGFTWRCGASWIEPFRHPAVETSSEQGPSGLRLTVREATPGGDYLRVEIVDGRLVFHAGPGGTAPVWIAGLDGVLHGSWNPSDMHRFVVRGQLLDRAVTRLLTRRHRYSSDTLFVGVHRLTERASATFTGDELVLRYPSDAQHVLAARTLRPGSDPIAHFGRLLDAQIEPVVQSHAIGIELSGGVDSANVAATASAFAWQEIAAFGLLVHGSTAPLQESRRAALVRKLGLLDTQVLAREHLPFSPGGPRSVDRAHYADGDVYYEAFDELRCLASGAGVRVMLTGFGGDELMSLRSAERSTPRDVGALPPWLGDRARAALSAVDTNIAPASPVAVPCLMAFAARHPAYLRWGLWPVAPLSAPSILRFTESLPVGWREGKRLLRSRLARRGLGPEVTHPVVQEGFGETMTLALRRHGVSMLEAMTQESILVEEGFVDLPELRRQVRHADAGGDLSPLLYDTLSVERGLQSMLRSGSVTGGGFD